MNIHVLALNFPSRAGSSQLLGLTAERLQPALGTSFSNTWLQPGRAASSSCLALRWSQHVPPVSGCSIPAAAGTNQGLVTERPTRPGSVAQPRCRLSPEGIADGWLHCLGMGHSQHSWHRGQFAAPLAGRQDSAGLGEATGVSLACNLWWQGSPIHKGKSNSNGLRNTALLHSDAKQSPLKWDV